MSAKALMIQGTMSNSGKSFITAGLCRIFKQDGYKVAPFKSQNMALNSYITKDHLEIGRAQAMQAEAAGIEPTVDMNPILLKPTSHTGSQVIVNGEVWADMKAMDYYKNKKALIPEVMKAYNKLASEYDIIVIEGGKTRNDTLINSIKYIDENFGIDDESIILTHDSVRPFVTHRIIEDNIDAAKRYGACDTVVPATDTIVESINSRTIESIPVRDYYYQGQTPQSFNIKKLFNLINSLTEEESNVLTDACKIFVLKDEDVYLVDGEVTNIKITYPYDLKLANTILEDIHD